MRGRLLLSALPVVSSLLLVACGGAEKAPAPGSSGSAASRQALAAKSESATPAVPAPPGPSGAAAAGVAVVDDSAPPSVRIRGRWAMNVAEVPDTALTEDFLEWKRQGKAAQLRVEYTITDSEFTLDTWAPNGRMHKKFHYEILKEMDESLLLKRIGEDGKEQEIPAVLRDGKLIIGTGNGQVPLARIE